MADELNIPIHEWLQDLRDRARMSQSEVDMKTRAMGGRVSQGYLSQLEKGYKPLEKMEASKMDALRRVYGISPEEWARRTGLTIITSDPAAQFSAAALYGKVPDAAPEIPDELLEAAELFGDSPEFAGLREPRWQAWLASAPHKRRPTSASGWLTFYSSVKDTIEP